MTIGQTPVGNEIVPEVLTRFQAILGRGSITGPSKQDGGYRLRISNFADVAATAAYLWPYLSPVKRRQFTKAITRNYNG